MNFFLVGGILAAVGTGQPRVAQAFGAALFLWLFAMEVADRAEHRAASSRCVCECAP